MIKQCILHVNLVFQIYAYSNSVNNRNIFNTKFLNRELLIRIFSHYSILSSIISFCKGYPNVSFIIKDTKAAVPDTNPKLIHGFKFADTNRPTTIGANTPPILETKEHSPVPKDLTGVG